MQKKKQVPVRNITLKYRHEKNHHSFFITVKKRIILFQSPYKENYKTKIILFQSIYKFYKAYNI